MTLVAGIDSSTQSTKVLVCDAETGAVVREGRAPHPDGTECPPEAWWAALGEAAAGGLLDGSWPHGGRRPAARHGRPRRRRRAGAPGAALERRALGARRRRSDRRAGRAAGVGRRGRQRARRRVHRHQAALAGPLRAGPRRAGRVGAAAARPPDLAAGRAAAAEADHRSRRRLRHRLLVAGHRGLPPGPAGARARPRRRGAAGRRPGRGRRRGGGARAGRAARPGHRRQHGRGARPGPRPR